MATVTFFFADQAGSTVQLERLGDAGAKGVRQALIDMLRQAAQDHHGKVIDHTGDGLMIAFGSAVDAIGCAVAVQQQAARHNARHPEDHALRVRIGIHTGEPLVNDEGRWFGVPLVVAARLCAQAESGQILVSDVTRALVAPRRIHPFTPLGERSLKGIAEPVPVAEVGWTPQEAEFAPPEVLAAAAEGPFVGRAAERAWLEGLWDQVRGRPDGARRRVALLAGDPGIGKTRLAASVARGVWEDGGLVLYGRCDEEPTLPYQPLAEALGPYVEAAPRAELRQQLGPAGGVLTRVLPGLADRVPNLAGRSRLEPETERFLVAEAIETLLVAVARATPTLLVLDDLQWADEATLLTVRQLARGGAPAPLLVLGCYREVEVGRSKVLAEVGVDPRRPGPIQHRSLAGLRADEVAELLAILTGETPAPELVRTVDAETEGNPYFVHQLAGNLIERKVAQRVGRAARRAESTRLDLRGVREEIVSGVLELQRLRDRPAGPGQAPDAAGDGPAAVAIEPDGTPPVPTSPPYKGLVRFEPEDAELFHGREQLVAQLVARLVAARFLAVVGASGSGKSSLVRAGLLPTLAAGALPGSDTWVPVVVTPGPEPVQALAERLAPLLPGADTAAVAGRLLAGSDALAEVAAEALHGRAEPARLMLIVDQFEEVFTASRDEATRRRFVDLLVTAARARLGRCAVAVALRADFYGRCAAHPELAAELADSQVLVGPMTDQELRRAVVEPAQRVGCVVEPGLPEAILADVAAEPGALPLVSTALLETWERRRGRSLTLGGYAESGGVRGAVARLADSVYASFDAREQAVARGILLRLTEPGEGVDDLRRRARREELGNDPVVEQVLGVLVARRLVTTDQGTVEVAHEALLREWPRLRAWLEEDREGRRLHRQLAGATDDWITHDRDPEQLYRGARLGAALDWSRQHQADLNQREREFLDASARHHERQLRRARRTTAILAGLLVIALLAGALALAQRSTARHQATLAQAGRLAALATARTGNQSDLALLLAVEGHRLDDSIQTRGGLVTALGQSPRLTGFHQKFGSDLSGGDLGPDGRTLAVGEQNGTLRLWDLGRDGPLTPPIHAHTGIFGPTFSPDGRTLATYGEDGLVRLWDVASGRPIGQPLRGHDRTVAGAAFSPDGRTLVTVGINDGTLRFWAVPSGRPIDRLDLAGDIGESQLLSVAISRTTGLIALGTGGGPKGSVLLIDPRTHRTRRTLALPANAGALTVDFSPDGRSLAANTDAGVLSFDVRTGMRRGQPLTGHEGAVNDVRFSPDGTTIASGGDDGSLILWDVASGARIGQPLVGQTGPIFSLHFLDRGRRLASMSRTEVATWDLGSVSLGRRVAAGSAQQTGTLDATPDGRLLAVVAGDAVQLWDATRERRAGPPLRNGAASVMDVALSPDGRLVAASTVGAQGGTRIAVWDVASRRQVGSLPTMSPMIGTVTFSPDSRIIAADNGGGTLALWDVATRHLHGRPLIIDPRKRFVFGIAFSPDGTTVASGGRLGEINLFEVASGRKLGELSGGHANPVTGLAFSPDGSLLASDSVDGSLVFWDPRRRVRVGERLAAGTAALTSLAFSPDGRTVATTSDTGALALWDVATRQQVGRPITGHTAAAGDVAFVAGGVKAVTSGGDGNLIFWELRPQAWEATACALAGRNFTRVEWAQFLAGPYRRTCPQWPPG